MDEPKLLESYSETVEEPRKEVPRPFIYMTVAAVAVLAYLLTIWLIFFHKTASAPKQSQANSVTSQALGKRPYAETSSKVQVTIDKVGFVPRTTIVMKGTEVIWVNRDQVAHQVALDPTLNKINLVDFIPKSLLPGESFSYTFWQSGSFAYFDNLTPESTKSANLHGQIVVRSN